MSQIEETEELGDEAGYLVYNETLIDHFMHPRNVGEIENPDAMAVVGDPTCGDFIRVYLKVEDGKISAFKFLTHGLSWSHFHFQHCHGIGHWEDPRRGTEAYRQ